MIWYFEQRRDEHGADGTADADPAAGLGDVPTALLERHGARVLHPPGAVTVSGWPEPQSTIYRARTLLIPGDLVMESSGAINQALAIVGMRITPRTEDTAGIAESGRDDARAGRPQVVTLVPAAPPDGEAARPVVIDAWVALQALRAAATAQTVPLDVSAVARIGLEHLLVGSAITGSPISEGGGVTGSPISEGGGVTGPGCTDSYLYNGGDARTPVDICLAAPPRLAAAECDSRYGRRPVVAVLDTGARVHPWLDVHKDRPGEYQAQPGGFVAVDPAMQEAIYLAGKIAESAGDRPRRLIRHPWDVPVTPNSLVGELDTHTGHGTFIAGIVRQIAADAKVLAVRIMHPDGIVYEGDLLLALSLLADRVAAGDPAELVDVLVLSLGYFSETEADAAYSFALWSVLSELLALGVTVVTAAGNYATSRKFYPAAFSDEPVAAGRAPLISVGALNPDGSKAVFSDGGRWIDAWATGAAMVSTFPTDINGSREPELSLAGYPAGPDPAGPPLPPRREALDPDDYASGFAVWSGTSFAAPLLAAVVAAELARGAEADPGLRLDQPGGPAAVARARHTLAALGWPG
jgi:subtilisin family serine protease